MIQYMFPGLIVLSTFVPFRQRNVRKTAVKLLPMKYSNGQKTGFTFSGRNGQFRNGDERAPTDIVERIRAWRVAVGQRSDV